MICTCIRNFNFAYKRFYSNPGKEEYVDFSEESKQLNSNSTANVTGTTTVTQSDSSVANIILKGIPLPTGGKGTGANMFFRGISRPPTEPPIVSTTEPYISSTVTSKMYTVFTHGESVSHNVGIYVWGAYQVHYHSDVNIINFRRV